MPGRTIARILFIVVLVGVAVGIGVTAYDAGLSTGLAQSGHVVVAPGDPELAEDLLHVPFDRALRDEELLRDRGVRAALGDETYTRIQAEGQAVTLEQAFTYALGEEGGSQLA